MILFDIPYMLIVFLLFSWGCLLLAISLLITVHALNKFASYKNETKA